MTNARDLGSEDEKLIALARASRVRTGAPEGAAVRDETGRTYAATSVSLPSLHLSALQAAIAAAVSSEARSLEAAAVVTEERELDEDDLAVSADLTTATVVLAAPDGSPTSVTRS